MKLISILFLLAAVALTSIPLVTASAYEKCHKIDSQIPYAIHKLCHHPRLKVPGARTSHGSRYGNIRVKIDGNCHPREHVHSQKCLDRFFHLCADNYGSTFGTHGTGAISHGCQQYIIERLDRPPHKHHKGDLITHKGG